MKPSTPWAASLPNPGSSQALALGCRCSPVLNHFGRGDSRGLYQPAPACALHGNHQVPVDGIRCGRCSAVLEVVGTKHLRTKCPNGCSPDDIDHPTATLTHHRAMLDAEASGAPDGADGEGARTVRRSRPTLGPRPCDVCGRPIAPSGKRGRPRLKHEECLSPIEQKSRERTRKGRARDAAEASV